jgi:hypothetical protein
MSRRFEPTQHAQATIINSGLIPYYIPPPIPRAHPASSPPVQPHGYAGKMMNIISSILTCIYPYVPFGNIVKTIISSYVSLSYSQLSFLSAMPPFALVILSIIDSASLLAIVVGWFFLPFLILLLLVLLVLCWPALAIWMLLERTRLAEVVGICLGGSGAEGEEEDPWTPPDAKWMLEKMARFFKMMRGR